MEYQVWGIVHQRQLLVCGHVARYPEADILLVGLFLKGIIRGGGGQGGAHKIHRWAKFMFNVRSYLVWEGGLHGACPG